MTILKWKAIEYLKATLSAAREAPLVLIETGKQNLVVVLLTTLLVVLFDGVLLHLFIGKYI